MFINTQKAQKLKTIPGTVVRVKNQSRNRA